MADRRGFGQNRQIEITVNGQNWGKPLAWDSSIRHNNGGNRFCNMGGDPQIQSFPGSKLYPNFLDIFGLTMSLTNLCVKIQMCDWGQILGCSFKEKGRDVG